ncbi:unnamed protein product [Rhodiola kirilowii]
MAAMSSHIFSTDPNSDRLLDRCSDMDHLKQVHGHIHKVGLTQHSAKLLKLYIKLSHDRDRSLTEAWLLFNRIEKPDVFTYNVMIKACCTSARPRKALVLYTRMLTDQVQCNGYTLPYVLKACRGFKGVPEIKQVHTHVLKTGYASETHAMNALIHAYAAVGEMESASGVFGSMVEKDVVSGNLIMNGLMNCGRVEEAFNVFLCMSEKSVVSWTTMIHGCVELGLVDEALGLFQDMMDSGVRPDKVALAGVVAACGESGSLTQGEWIHSYIKRNKIEVDSTLRCVLIDMYAKCGALDRAEEVFNQINDEKSVATWTALISGFGAHGRAQESLKWFYRMQEAGVRPNSITFTSILTACSHAGLVNEGEIIFRSMEAVYEFKPSVEHYGCMVDLMARAGLVEQAMNLINNMPIERNAAIWGAMAQACCTGKHIELGQKIGKKLIELEPDKAGRYVQLASMYALVGDWDRAAATREQMKHNDRVSKVVGRSLIYLKGNVFQFLATP